MERNNDSVYSQRVKAGKRRTYFFDVKSTRTNDYYLVLTESINRFDNKNGFDRHKIFVYKEDFNKFLKGLTDAVDFVKTELMPNFDFDSFSNEYYENQSTENDKAELKETTTTQEPIAANTVTNTEITTNNTANEEVDKW